jgi:hypothetical protein
MRAREGAGERMEGKRGRAVLSIWSAALSSRSFILGFRG